MESIIINADDFGLNPSVNNAIVELFNKGLINSTTIMANMPYFEEAVEMAYHNNFIDHIGIHLTLGDGNPLTTNILSTNLFNHDNTNFNKIRRKLFFISENEKKMIYYEFSAQVKKVMETGIKITHIDTHHHIHEIWPVLQILFALLKTTNIASMRILNNLNRSARYKRIYRNILNNQIKIKGAEFTDYFGNQLEVISQCNLDRSIFKGKNLEIMVHPDFNNQGVIIDKINNHEYNLEYCEDLRRLISTN
jgi:chitin disaccharide deacetylase